MELIRSGYTNCTERPAKLLKRAIQNDTNFPLVARQLLERLERDAKIRTLVLAASPSNTTYVARSLINAMSGAEDLHSWCICASKNISLSEQLEALSGAIWKTTMRMVARIRGIAYVDELCGKRSANFDSGIVMEDRRRVYHYASHIRLLRADLAHVVGKECAIPLSFATDEIMNAEEFAFYKTCLVRWLERVTEMFDALAFEGVLFLRELPKSLLSACSNADVSNERWRFADRGGTEVRVVECEKCVFQAHKCMTHLLLWSSDSLIDYHYSHMRTKIKKQSSRAPPRRVYRQLLSRVIKDLRETPVQDDLYIRVWNVVQDPERAARAKICLSVTSAINESFSFSPFLRQTVMRSTAMDGLEIASPQTAKIVDRADIPVPGDAMGALVSLARVFPNHWELIAGDGIWNPSVPKAKHLGTVSTVDEAKKILGRMLEHEPDISPASTYFVKSENALITVFGIAKTGVLRISGAQHLAEERFDLISCLLAFARYKGHYRMCSTHPFFVADVRREWPTAFFMMTDDLGHTFPKSSHAVIERETIEKFYVVRKENAVVNPKVLVGKWKNAQVFFAKTDDEAREMVSGTDQVEHVSAQDKEFFSNIAVVHPNCYTKRTFPCFLFCALWSRATGQSSVISGSIPIICVEADLAVRQVCKTVTCILRTVRTMVESSGGLTPNGVFHWLDAAPTDAFAIDPRALCYAPLGGWVERNEKISSALVLERYVDRLECSYTSARGRSDGTNIMVPLLHPRVCREETEKDISQKIEVTLIAGQLNKLAYKCALNATYARPYPHMPKWMLQPTSHPFALLPGSTCVFHAQQMACGDDIRAWAQLQTPPYFFVPSEKLAVQTHSFFENPEVAEKVWFFDPVADYALLDGDMECMSSSIKTTWLPISGTTLVETRTLQFRGSFMYGPHTWQARAQLDKLLAEHLGRAKWVLQAPESVRVNFLQSAFYGRVQDPETYAKESSTWALRVMFDSVGALCAMTNNIEIVQHACDMLKERANNFCAARNKSFVEPVSLMEALAIVRESCAIAGAVVAKTALRAADTMQACWALHTIVMNAFKKNIEHHEHEAIACVANIANSLRCSIRARPRDEDLVWALEPDESKLVYLETRKTKDATTNERESLARATAHVLDIYTEGLLHFRHMRDWAFSSKFAEIVELKMRPPFSALPENSGPHVCDLPKWDLPSFDTAKFLQGIPDISIFPECDLDGLRYVKRVSLGEYDVEDHNVTLFTFPEYPKKMFLLAACDVNAAPYALEEIPVRVTLTQVLATYEFSIAPFTKKHSEWTTTGLRHKGRYWCFLKSVDDNNNDARIAYAIIAISATKFQKSAALGTLLKTT